MNQEELRYSQSHEWVHVAEVDGDQIATIGISAFAVAELSDLVFIELPEVGREVAAGDEFGEVESVKAVSPIYAPVNGTVVEVNAELPDDLDRLSQDPFGAGWLAKVKLAADSGLGNLLDHATYQKQCSEEG